MNCDFKIRLLEAKTGDSFIVECGNRAFLIDGGTRVVANDIKRYLGGDKTCQLEAIFVTHVDNDHVGGIVKLFTNFKKFVPITVPVYMNHPCLVHANTNQEALVTYQDGDTLKSLLEVNNYSLKEAKSNQIINFDDVVFNILTPNQVLLDCLYKSWDKKIDEGLVSSDIIEIDFSVIPDEPKNTLGNDIINASSMSFIMSYKSKSILFLSDSLPEVMDEVIVTKRKFDVVKVSHHGSKHNTSLKLLEKIDCNNFIISTNGPRNYKHPHPETIIRLIHSCIHHGYKECNLYFNYKRVLERIKLSNIPEGFTVNLIHSNVMSL